jgi:hypothetical protein
MKHRSYSILVALTLGLLSSCSLPEAELIEEYGGDELFATLESDAETRTHLSGLEDGVYYPYWSGEEELAVYINGRSLPARFMFVSGKDTREATFAGAGTGNHYMALYPYGAEEELDGTDLTLTLPSEQTYRPGSFAEGAFPMLAVSSTNHLSFRNLCSVLRISMTGKKSVQSILLTVNDPQASVSGKARVRTSDAENPTLTMLEGGSSFVRLICDGVSLSEETPTDFFIVIPPGTYRGGFTLKIKTDEGTAYCRVEDDIRFERSQMRSISGFDCSDTQIDPDDLPDNVILYTTSSEEPVWVDSSRFDREIVSNTYENGQGMLVFDGPVKSLDTYCFWRTNLTAITLPSSVEKIGQWAFSKTLLKTFRIPDNLQLLYYGAFAGCEQLSSFSGPHVSSDGMSVIYDNMIVAHIVREETITFPEGILGAAQESFIYSEESRRNVKSIVFPEGFISVGPVNFEDLPNLEYVTLSSTCNVAWQGTFSGCPNLKKFLGDNALIWDQGNCLVDAEGYMTVFAGAGMTDYVIPEGVRYLCDGVFYEKSSLRSLTFPDSFCGVINRPFDGADNLSFFYGKNTSEDAHSLVINGVVVAVAPGVEDYTSPEGAISLGYALFGRHVKSITLNDCVRDTDGYAFYYANNLQTLVLSASMKSVGYYCFDGPRQLKDVYFRSSTPPQCGPIFDWVSFRDDLVVHVPEESLEAYRQSSDWSFFAPYFQGYQVQDLPENPSPDGNVTVLQRATEGAGLDLVLMGDAFTEAQIADGTYGWTMQRLADAFFSVEPYKSFRHLFNVYRVDVVSQTGGYDQPGQMLGTWFGEGTTVGGDDQACFRYAHYAISDERLDDALIVVAMNSPKYGGTCYMYRVSDGDYGRGPSIAYFPIGETDESMAQVLHHEAGGHGFAKLADEYAYESNGAIPTSTMIDKRNEFQYGWWKNADFTDDPVAVKWSRFLADARYRDEGLGCFEGAFTYWTGAWRPTEDSIMRHNTGGFNAPSREAIWYRIHKLAYGSSWDYDYEEFVAYDAINRTTSASTSSARSRRLEPTYPPLAPPVVIDRRWNEAASGPAIP